MTRSYCVKERRKESNRRKNEKAKEMFRNTKNSKKKKTKMCEDAEWLNLKLKCNKSSKKKKVSLNCKFIVYVIDSSKSTL